MDLSHFTAEAPAARRDGWSPELKVRFLDHLAARGTVRSACALVHMSREAAYRLRRRDPLFARGWNAALALARDNGADVLTCHAIEGIEEDVWYRGELVGKRIRHDARLLLAHLARLDRMVEQNPAGNDAERFDELLAVVGGSEPPEDLLGDDQIVPLDREDCFIGTLEATEARLLAAGEDDRAAFDGAHDAGTIARVRWDEWFGHACGRVDELLGEAEFLPRTVSTVSTSEPGHPPLDGERTV